MPPIFHLQNTIGHRSLRRGSLKRVIGAGLAIFFLILQMLVPVVGQAAGVGDRIEICSEFGVIEVTIPAEGSDVPDCSECPTCALCALSHSVVPEPAAKSASIDSVPLSWVPYKTGLTVQNPAQFWPDNRGPPLGQPTTTKLPGRMLGMSFQPKGEAS